MASRWKERSISEQERHVRLAFLAALAGCNRLANKAHTVQQHAYVLSSLGSCILHRRLNRVCDRWGQHTDRATALHDSCFELSSRHRTRLAPSFPPPATAIVSRGRSTRLTDAQRRLRVPIGSHGSAPAPLRTLKPRQETWPESQGIGMTLFRHRRFYGWGRIEAYVDPAYAITECYHSTVNVGIGDTMPGFCGISNVPLWMQLPGRGSKEHTAPLQTNMLPVLGHLLIYAVHQNSSCPDRCLKMPSSQPMKYPGSGRGSPSQSAGLHYRRGSTHRTFAAPQARAAPVSTSSKAAKS